MSRHPRWRWLTYAIALSCVASSASADKKVKKRRNSVGECASFDQRDRESEDGVDLTITSSCEPTLACAIKWSLTCAPGSKRASRTREHASLQLSTGESKDVTASADRCGADGWAISEITWSCEPVPK